jgi:hypothetical protein
MSCVKTEIAKLLGSVFGKARQGFFVFRYRGLGELYNDFFLGEGEYAPGLGVVRAGRVAGGLYYALYVFFGYRAGKVFSVGGSAGKKFFELVNVHRTFQYSGFARLCHRVWLRQFREGGYCSHAFLFAVEIV